MLKYHCFKSFITHKLLLLLLLLTKYIWGFRMPLHNVLANTKIKTCTLTSWGSGRQTTNLKNQGKQYKQWLMLIFPKHLLQYFDADLEVLCYSAKAKQISCLRIDYFIILLSLKAFILIPKIITVLYKKLMKHFITK